MKVCCTCRERLPLSEFYASRSHKDGKYPSCRPCARARKKASNERVKQRDREGHAERRKAAVRRYSTRFPERVRALEDRRRLRQYGLTPERYDEMLVAQGGVCAICRKDSRRKLAVDHDHETGRVRGLLCDKCNLAIGQLGDTPLALRRAVAYLEAAPCR